MRKGSVKLSRFMESLFRPFELPLYIELENNEGDEEFDERYRHTIKSFSLYKTPGSKIMSKSGSISNRLDSSQLRDKMHILPTV